MQLGMGWIVPTTTPWWHNGAAGGSWGLIALRPAVSTAIVGVGSGSPDDAVERALNAELEDGR